MVSLHDGHKVTVHIVAIGASERLRGKELAPNYSVFETTLRRLRLAHLPVLDPPAILDVTFFDHCYYADEATSNQLDSLSEALFQGRLAHLSRSRQCDVLNRFCHIASGNDIFVTSDLNFHRKAMAVRETSDVTVAGPSEAVVRAFADLQPT